MGKKRAPAVDREIVMSNLPKWLSDRCRQRRAGRGRCPSWPFRAAEEPEVGSGKASGPSGNRRRCTDSRLA